MRLFTKTLYIMGCCLALSACGGSSSSGGNGGGGGGPTPTKVSAVNLGNISAIPTNGDQTTTSLIVTNNTSSNLTLTSGTINQNSKISPVNIQTINSSTSFGMVNVSQCSNLQANGTCSVTVTAPTTAGSYLLTLNFSDGSHSYTTSQVVTFTNTIPSANGFIYSNLNNNLYMPSGGGTTYSIPFVLDNNYANLYAYSNNPAFTTNLICPGGSTYSKGDLCTAYVYVSGLGDNPNVTAIVTVSTLPDPNSAKVQGMTNKQSIKGAVAYSFNTPVTVANNNTGNIVSSAINLVINPADGSSPQTVTLLNNGSATVSGITITPVGGIITLDNSGVNSCAAAGNSLASGASCNFKVNANTQTNGSNTVNVSYNNGGSGNTNGMTSFTVVYMSATPGPGMSMTAGQGSLQNALVNFTSSLNIQVTNTGNVPLTNVSFTNITSVYGSQFTYSSAGTCATDGTQSLPVGGQCTLVVNYLPTAAHALATLTINETAQYPLGSGFQNYTGSAFSTSYSAFVNNAFVYLTPNSVSYAIRSDNVDTASQTITVANFGGQTATLSTPSYTLSSALTGILSAIHITDGCAESTLLANNANTCTISVVYGPVAASQALVSGYLNVAYKPVPSSSGTVNAFSAQSFQAESAALITVSAPVESGASGASSAPGGSGNGTAGSPYQFYNSAFAGSPIILTYTYTNTGTASANFFIVNLANLPLGWAVSGSPTCGYGATPSTLAPLASCKIAITAMSPGTFWNPYAVAGAINVVTPGFSYSDSNTGLNYGPSSPATTYVMPLLFANVGESPITSNTVTSGGSFNLTFTSTSGVSGQYPIKITIPPTSLPVGSGSGAQIYLTSSNTCTISSVTGNCQINVTNIIGAATSTYSYQYWVTPAGLTPSASNSIIQYLTFTLQ